VLSDLGLDYDEILAHKASGAVLYHGRKKQVGNPVSSGLGSALNST
jgi:hypothetical protein